MPQENPAEEDGKPMFGSLVGEAGECLLSIRGVNQAPSEQPADITWRISHVQPQS